MIERILFIVWLIGLLPTARIVLREIAKRQYCHGPSHDQFDFRSTCQIVHTSTCWRSEPGGREIGWIDIGLASLLSLWWPVLAFPLLIKATYKPPALPADEAIRRLEAENDRLRELTER